MGNVHGRHTVIILDDNDLSAYCNTSELTRGADIHDTTTYGKLAHVHEGGLLNGTASMGGLYDNTASTGPRAVLAPLLGQKVELIRQPEGAGTGKPQDKVDVVVGQYVETNPVADMVTWTCDLTLSDTVDTTPQAGS
ncbi:hypothetical protein ACIBF5_32605 [Micromonospora sp. NPDC050417]|uniref:hypothetical protein n=1 Tax=Micromonospora sp. NPDC050417 TaxID=3364280 RepID=UPI0037B59F39